MKPQRQPGQKPTIEKMSWNYGTGDFALDHPNAPTRRFNDRPHTWTRRPLSTLRPGTPHNDGRSIGVSGGRPRDGGGSGTRHALASLELVNLTGGSGRKHAVRAGINLLKAGAQKVTFFLQTLHLAFQVKDALDARKVNALILGHALHVAQTLNVTLRVAPSPALRASRDHQTQPVILAQGLGVHTGQLGRHRNDEGRLGASSPRRAAGFTRWIHSLCARHDMNPFP